MSTIFIILTIVAVVLILALRNKAGTPFEWATNEPKIFEEKVASLSKYPGTFDFDIVGESHHQSELAEICGGKTAAGHNFETPALLVPYRSIHDNEAVAVLMGDCVVVGHLSRNDAKKLRTAMVNMKLGGCSLRVPAKIVGGWKRGTSNEGSFGVKLDLPT